MSGRDKKMRSDVSIRPELSFVAELDEVLVVRVRGFMRQCYNNKE